MRLAELGRGVCVLQARRARRLGCPRADALAGDRGCDLPHGARLVGGLHRQRRARHHAQALGRRPATYPVRPPQLHGAVGGARRLRRQRLRVSGHTHTARPGRVPAASRGNADELSALERHDRRPRLSLGRPRRRIRLRRRRHRGNGAARPADGTGTPTGGGARLRRDEERGLCRVPAALRVQRGGAPLRVACLVPAFARAGEPAGARRAGPRHRPTARGQECQL